MKQHLFEQRHQEEWTQFAARLALLEKNKASPADSSAFASSYRRICLHVALAEERNYSPLLIDQLRALALRGHQQFYRHNSHFVRSLLNFIFAGFAQAVRREWRFILCASAVFFGSFAFMGVLCFFYPDLIYSVLDTNTLSGIEEMYAPETAQQRGADRAAEDDFFMFGYYIMNNIGIGFQTYASGLLYGLGSLFFLLFNGIYIGAIAGYLSSIGSHDTFWSFVIAHGAFELTAIALAGAAGLKLGWALIAPGHLPRLEALRIAATQSMPIVYGMFLFLLIAAFIEAYWSSITFPSNGIKYLVGGTLWALVLAYFAFAGRQHAPH